VFIENVKGDRAGSWETGVGGVGIKMTPINLKGFRVDLIYLVKATYINLENNSKAYERESPPCHAHLLHPTFTIFYFFYFCSSSLIY